MSQQQALAAASTSLLIGGIITVVALVFGIICWWRILSKAGYSGPLSLLLLIPVVNIIAGIVLLLILAFGEWPVLTELNARRQQGAMGSSFPPGQSGGGYGNPSYPQYPQNPQYPR